MSKSVAFSYLLLISQLFGCAAVGLRRDSGSPWAIWPWKGEQASVGSPVPNQRTSSPEKLPAAESRTAGGDGEPKEDPGASDQDLRLVNQAFGQSPTQTNPTGANDTANGDLEVGPSEAVDTAPDDAKQGTGDPVASDPEQEKIRQAPAPAIELLPVPNSADRDDSPEDPVTLYDVVSSVHGSFPLLEVAYLENQVAGGNQIAAWGSFDKTLYANSLNQPLGFYQTYRQRLGFVQPLYGGGEYFAGYRVGRGEFEPWYKERQTDQGGEFHVGVRVPLGRNRDIDARRAQLWRANYEVQRVQPEIRVQLIRFVRDATVAYWTWVATARQYEVIEDVLELALRRNAQIKRQVEEGDIDPPNLDDNLRAIADRRAELVDRDRQLQQAAIALSLFLRDAQGRPALPTAGRIADFPSLERLADPDLEADIQAALSSRPELAALDAVVNQVNVDLAEARNDLLPNVDAQVYGSQDVGVPATPLRDKSRFELEAGLAFEMPVQRRRAIGKMQAARGKLMQLSAERRFIQDTIVADVQQAYAAVVAAAEQLVQARENKRLAECLFLHFICSFKQRFFMHQRDHEFCVFFFHPFTGRRQAQTNGFGPAGKKPPGKPVTKGDHFFGQFWRIIQDSKNISGLLDHGVLIDAHDKRINGTRTERNQDLLSDMNLLAQVIRDFVLKGAIDGIANPVNNNLGILLVPSFLSHKRTPFFFFKF